MLVRCSNKFIKDSWKLPDVIVNKVICKTPSVLNVLDGFVDPKVIEMINAGDIEGALTHFNGIKAQDSKNIVESVTNSLVNEKHNLKLYLRQKKQNL